MDGGLHMLSYLILTTRAILIATICCGVATGYTRIAANKTQRKAVWALMIVGTIASIVIAVLRNATSKIDSAILNGRIYAISLTAYTLYLIFTLTPLGKKGGIMQMISWVLLGIVLMTVIAYAMPEIWGYPYHILLSEKTVISTDFLMGIIGMAAALILAAATFFGTMKSTMRLSLRGAGILLNLELLIHSALRLSGLFSVLFQKKIIKSVHTLFVYTVFVKNHTDWFIYLSLFLVCVAAVILWAQSFKQNEPYRNPAEHRKIRAKWRSIRRWASVILVCGVLSVLIMTVIDKMSQTDVTLSPIEDASDMDDENVYVSFDLVADGHLHRFAYESENGVQIRFIIIKKPNSQSYGVGLDACDVCGETGYYEKDGQVVCNLCDVVMNISTIGFKGGCNPIVIPYEIRNGQIIVPISGLLEYEREFK